MSTVSPVNGIRIVELTDGPANIQTVVSNVVTDIDRSLVPRFSSTAARDSAIPTPSEGMLCYLTGTGIGLHTLQRYTGSAWARMQEAPLFVRKTVTETVTASTTVQNDDQLVLAVAANTTYEFVCQVAYDGNSTADIKLGFTFPASATMDYYASGYGIGVGAQFSLWSFVAGGAAGLGTVSPSQMQGFSDETATSLTAIRLYGILQVGSTAGNLQLQWAQNTSNAVATRVLAGSYLKLERMA